MSGEQDERFLRSGSAGEIDVDIPGEACKVWQGPFLFC